jgi:uncharacterized protein (TIGR00369 family)
MSLSNFELMKAVINGAVPTDARPGFTFPPPIAKFIGFTLTDITDEPSATMEMVADLSKHANPMGTLHGGVLVDIADAAIGCAHWSTLQDGQSFTSIDMKINFFRPMWNGKIKAVSHLINGGKTVSYYNCDVIRVEDGKLLATATSAIMTLHGEKAKGR